MKQIQHPVYDVTVDISRHDPVQFDGTQSCRGVPTEVFYYSLNDDESLMRDSWVEQDVAVSPAVQVNAMLDRVCITCPLLEPCFSYALHHEEYGFWGGSSAVQRTKLRKEHGITLEPVNDSDAFDLMIRTRRLEHELELSFVDWEDE